MDGPGDKIKNDPTQTPVEPTQPAEISPQNNGAARPTGAVEKSVAEIEAAEEEPPAPKPPLPGTTLPNEAAFQIPPPGGKFRRLLKSKKFWAVVVLGLLAIAIALWFVQPSRIFIVNLLGLKVPVKVTTRTIAEPNQPSAVLKSVTVAINGANYTSDAEGLVQTSVPYGPVNIAATKSGYEAASSSSFYDFNPFFNLVGAALNGEQQVDLQLKSVGLPLVFSAKDWLTDGPVTQGKFSVGDVVAQPDSQGMVSFKVPPTDSDTVTVKATFGGVYNDMEFAAKIQEDPVQEFLFVPAGKDYFVSKRSGQFVVYSSNLDGSQVTEIVPASANETAAIDFAVSPSGKFAALASTREGKKDTAGQLLQKLYVVNLSNNQLAALDEGRWFDFIDWSGDTLVYTTAMGTTTPQRLSSVDLTNGKKADLSSAASYGAARVSLGNVVYQINHAASDTGAANNPELRVVPVKGGAEKNIGNKVEVLTQTDFDKFAYQTSDKAWHQYDANTTQVTNISAPTSVSRAYLGSASPDGQTRLLIDRIDGKNTLITESVANGQEKQLYGAAGLQGPVRWVGGVIVFRVVDSLQSADYVLSASGGQPKKITDVTDSVNTFGDAYFGFF